MLISLSPTHWGKLKLSNRIVMAPMCMYQANEFGVIQPFHYTHYTTRAYGGVAMVVVEATSVEARGRISNQDLGIYSDDHIAGLTALVHQVHLAGSLIAIQLAHAGRKSGVKDSNGIAPTALRFSQDYQEPTMMSLKDIHDVIQSFKKAGERAQRSGFDGVEIHGAHGYLINQFISPLTNHRRDQYGGSLTNRFRFLKEILEAVHQTFHGEIWVRLSVEEYAEGGHHIEETIQGLKLIQTLIAGVNVSSGGVVPFPIKAGPGYQLPFSKAIKQMGISTIGGGLVTTLDQIEAALISDADLIYLGRELLLNPYFVLQTIKKHAPERMLKPYQRG